MAEFVITSHYLTSTRGINGGEEMPGTRTTVTAKRWIDAAHLYRTAVYDATKSLGLLDTNAGYEARDSATIGTYAPMKPKSYDKVTNVANSIRVRLRRVA